MSQHVATFIGSISVFWAFMKHLDLRGFAIGSISEFLGLLMCWSLHLLDLGVLGFDKVFGPLWGYGWLYFSVPGFVDMLEVSLAQFQHFGVRQGVWTFMVLMLAQFQCSSVR